MTLRIVERRNILTLAECASLMQKFGTKLERSTVAGEDRTRRLSEVRTSSDYRFQPAELGALGAKLDEALVEVTSRPLQCREPWQLLRYEPGQFYQTHVDWFRRRWLVAQRVHGGQRTHSAIVYLCDVPSGGATLFPLLGRVIVPEAGKLVAWNNLSERGRPLAEARHEAQTIERGEKWVLVTWFRERPYSSGTTPEPLGAELNPEPVP